MTWLLPFLGEFWPEIAGLFASLVAVVVAYLKGGSRQKMKQDLQDAESEKKAHGRIDKIPVVDASDRYSIVERLRKHGQ